MLTSSGGGSGGAGGGGEGGGCGEQFHRQVSTSPTRPSAPKPIGAKHQPPKITKASSSSI
uniref:Uncharacterized protein n=1 Tax=Nelumbo nucifera TaxID=4432 RepID=A0A822XFE2_NELNU|nr:TPA_asm: hypothetical protein HUJ06_020380 [Nelumbo nucifera]